MERHINNIKLAVRRVMHQVARAINKLSAGHISPNSVTWFGFAMHVPIAWLIAMNHVVLAAILLVIFGLFDTLDGELARLQKKVTSTGGFLDAVTDRFKEVLLYTGAAYALTTGTHPRLAVVAVAACGASICVSFVKAKGEAIVGSLNHTIPYTELNHLFSGGFFPFEIRMTVLAIGLFSNQLAWALVIITLASSATAINRLIIIAQRLSV